MTVPPPLTDRPALARHRARARRHPDHDDALFLHRIARSDIEERLIEVNRTFTAPAVVTGFPEVWADLRADVVIVPDDELLALQPQAHDLVIHAMGLHWSNDPVGQLVQCRRSLKPDGLCIATFPAGRTLGELRASLAEAELSGLYRDLRAMGEANSLSARSRTFTPRRVFAAAEAIYRTGFATPEGHLQATFELQFLTGWAPHESQQTPLRPGSAKARLADALRVPERPLPKGG
jgi:SAM-dependent methyltransferase